MLGLSCLCLFACVEKDPAGPPSVVGKSAEAAAEIATEAVCEHVDRCGLITITCADCAADEECGGCSAELEEIAYDACAMELGEQLADGFACETITDEEAAQVDACLRALAQGECPTVEQAEAWARGGPGEDPRQPAACETLEDIRWRCFEQGEPKGMVPEPLPG